MMKTDQLSILLVEDCPDNQNLVQLFLQGIQVRLLMAQDGQEGVELFKKHSFHLVLMDIQMPRKDGITAIREIRQYETQLGKAPTPIVVQSAFIHAEDRKQGLLAGCNATLKKPLDKESLLQAILYFTNCGSELPSSHKFKK